ncbi:hypothetical protein [uncultured Desulfovibrio sp.]|uniref:hypothetical protein n=1 Tax=uncultured Desulfovibrio sp. TaxID=167968 RepID=UPI002638A65D|nr:hypothetical protein [uncultured Desulfovibrio sp.]
MYGKAGWQKVAALRFTFSKVKRSPREGSSRPFSLRRKQAHKAQEGNYKTPNLTSAGRTKSAAATEKEPATPHESEAAQRLEKRERHPQNVFQAKAAAQEDAPPECLTRAFPRGCF